MPPEFDRRRRKLWNMQKSLRERSRSLGVPACPRLSRFRRGLLTFSVSGVTAIVPLMQGALDLLELGDAAKVDQ